MSLKPIEMHDSMGALEPAAVACVLLLHKALELEQLPPELTAEEIGSMSPEALQEACELYIGDTDARNEVRHGGDETELATRIDRSWERNYEVEVHAIPITEDKALAFNYVYGGGKHGEPAAYPWEDECWFVKITGTKTVVITSFAEIEEK